MCRKGFRLSLGSILGCKYWKISLGQSSFNLFPFKRNRKEVVNWRISLAAMEY